MGKIQDTFKVKQPKFKNIPGEAGYDNARDNIDPHIISKVIEVKEGTIQKTPANNADIVNKAYCDSNGLWEIDGTETQLKTADEIDMQTKKIINVTDPTDNQDAATKKYVDDSSTAPGGNSGNIQYNDSGSFGGEDALVWDATNNRIGIGTTAPACIIHAKQTTGDPAFKLERSGTDYFGIRMFSTFATIDTFGTSDLWLRPANQDHIVIKGATGYVGLGVSNPSAKLQVNGNIYPGSNNTYYLGKNDDDSPMAWKGLILKDTTDGKYYRIEVINGVITATDLTD